MECTKPFFNKHIQYFALAEVEATPFSEEAQCEQIDYTTTSATTEDFLERNIDTGQIDALTGHFINKLRRIELFELSKYIKNEVFSQKIKIWNKVTTPPPLWLAS